VQAQACPWRNSAASGFVKYVYVDDAYQALERRYGAWRRTGPEPIFSDSEVITIALICDTFFHGDEGLCLCFVRSFWLHLFPNLPERSRFNRLIANWR